jgi:DNA-binding NarL/FixJ family response regulator
MATVSPQRTREDLVRLAHRGLGVREFSLAAARALRRVVAFDGVCVMTMDPATLLPTGHVIVNGLPDDVTVRLAEIELREPDFNKFVELARGDVPAASLSAATGGDLDRSIRQRELRRPHGFEDELRAAFTGGGIVLLRETGTAHFASSDASFLGSVSADLAEGLRRDLLLGSFGSDDGDPEVGLLVLADDDTVEMANQRALEWLDELRDEGAPDDRVPFVVRTAAATARAVAGGHASDRAAASARVRARSGRWVLVRGSMLGEGADARAAVILEPARAPELAPLIVEAYGFTRRERAVTELVAQGLSTNQIATRLHIAPYTVQDHLKAIFEKAGVTTRGELVARLFFDHFAPRLTSWAGDRSAL